MPEPLISIIIPTFNAQQFIAETLDSILHQSYQNFEILVISNSRIESEGETLNKIKGVHFIDNKRNMGCCYPNNQALKFAIKKKCKYIGIFNNDIEFDKDFLEEIIYRQLQEILYGN